MVFQQFIRGATNVAARLYQRSLAKNLKEYGNSMLNNLALLI